MFDLRCLDDLSLDAAECSNEVEELEQDVYHRISTTKGQNIDDENLGQSISDFLSQKFDLVTAQKLLEHEIEEDPRVHRATAVIVESSEPHVYNVAIEVETNEQELIKVRATV